MGRIHFFEIHDQAWCPRMLRQFATDYLAKAEDAGRVYDGIAGKLWDAVRRTGSRQIVDLCSAGAGPWPRLCRLGSQTGPVSIDILLTDLYPVAAAPLAGNGNVRAYPEPVDARQVPGTLRGFRTLFSSFHHFRPEEARAILWNAAHGGEGIAVFEGTERSGKAIALMLLTPLMVWLMTPGIRPFRWSRLLFTYLIPIVPVMVLFDGIVSCLRTYSEEELQELTQSIEGTGYTWEIGRIPIPRSPLHVTYLVGLPGNVFTPPDD